MYCLLTLQVLIRSEAIGVNPVEVIIRNGHFGPRITVPYVPGSDVGGVVEKVGPGVDKVKVINVLGILISFHLLEYLCSSLCVSIPRCTLVIQ